MRCVLLYKNNHSLLIQKGGGKNVVVVLNIPKVSGGGGPGQLYVYLWRRIWDVFQTGLKCPSPTTEATVSGTVCPSGPC